MSSIVINMAIAKIMEKRPKWSELIENTIKQLEKETIDKDDRLTMAKKLARLIVILMKSLEGWKQWMNFEVMDSITKKEFRELYPKLSKVIIEFLKIDAEISKKKEDEAEEKIKKLIAEQKKKGKKGEKCAGCKTKEKKNVLII